MTRRMTGPERAVRQAVLEAARGKCQRCGLATALLVIHHRKPRRMGGTRDPQINDPVNLAVLCDYRPNSCHRWTESNPADAYATGWLVHDWQDPADIEPQPLETTTW